MTRLAKIGFGLVTASCLLLAVERQVVEAAAPAATGGIGLIDVQQSDLGQAAIEDNWVSYNGDYTGRRYSSLTADHAGERRPPGSEVGLPYPGSWPARSDSRRRSGRHVRYQRQRRVCAGRENGQGSSGIMHAPSRRD